MDYLIWHLVIMSEIYIFAKSRAAGRSCPTSIVGKALSEFSGAPLLPTQEPYALRIFVFGHEECLPRRIEHLTAPDTQCAEVSS